MALQIGTAVVDITPRTPCFLAGYAGRDHGHESVHDPISLRAFYARGSNGDALVISADILWFSDAIIEHALPVLETELGIPSGHVFFIGTHTHSAPNVYNDANKAWAQMVEAQVVAASALAKSRLQDATLFGTTGESKIGINRREQLPDGKIILGENPDGPIDREVILVEVRDSAGEAIGRLGNFACHGTMLNQRNYQLSGDWPGLAASKLEADGGSPFVFLNGGCANIAPRDDRRESFEKVEALSSEFVNDVKGMVAGLGALDGDDAIVGAELDIHLPRKLRDVDEGMGKFCKVRIQGLRIGPLRIIGFPGEVFAQTAMAVKENHPMTMVCSYVAGSRAGYVPVAEAYETGGYEVRVSPYAEEAEAVLRQGLLDLLDKLK
jgi:neutral ceramidase